MHAGSDEGSESYAGRLRVPGEAGGGEPDDGKLSRSVRREVRGVPAKDASAPTLPKARTGATRNAAGVSMAKPHLLRPAERRVSSIAEPRPEADAIAAA